jgi:hypothetical protein
MGPEDLELETLIKQSLVLEKHLEQHKLRVVEVEADGMDTAIFEKKLRNVNQLIKYFEGEKRAALISQMLHFADPNTDKPRRMVWMDLFLASNPIDSWTLVALIGLEREKTKSKLEIEVARRMSRKRSELSQSSHKDRNPAKVKPEILAFYEKNARNILPNGKPQFKTKAAFIRAVREDKKWNECVQDDNTIANWIKRESTVIVEHWKTRTKKK